MKLNDTLSYDPHSDEWARHKTMPFFLSGWEGATYQDRYVILIGGVEAKEISEEKMGQNTWNDIIFAYDTKYDRWMRLESLTPPGGVYNDPGVVIVGDSIYVVGGEGPRGSHFDHFLVGKIKMATQPTQP
jgi:N-acetylneuraminic acid mutarotase